MYVVCGAFDDRAVEMYMHAYSGKPLLLEVRALTSTGNLDARYQTRVRPAADYTGCLL